MPAHPKPAKRKRKLRPGRLDKNGIAILRAQCFERDGYRCQHEIRKPEGPMQDGRTFWFEKCLKPVIWDTGHMAHIKSRGAGGSDTLDNVVTKCQRCHIIYEHGGVDPITGSVHDRKA